MKPFTELLLQIALLMFIVDWVLIQIESGLRLLLQQLESQDKKERIPFLAFLAFVTSIALSIVYVIAK